MNYILFKDKDDVFSSVCPGLLWYVRFKQYAQKEYKDVLFITSVMIKTEE